MTDLSPPGPTPGPTAGPAPGRSLWVDARARLLANRAATVSAVLLMVMTLLCALGPLLLPNDFNTIHQNYTKVPPSLSAYPKPEMIGPALEKAAGRARIEVLDWAQDGAVITATLTSAKPIDDRAARYFDRSDLFHDSRIETLDDGRARLTARVKQSWFFFGTDQNGRDLLARTLIAGRVSLAIGLMAGLVAVAIGVVYGAVSGFVGGRTDEVMMRVVDILYSLPFIFFVIMLVVFFGRNFLLTFLAVGAVMWLDMARIVRGQTLALKRLEFVQAAEALGVSRAGILRRHILPNLLGPVIIYMTLLVPTVIIMESFLSYLGLGVQEPMSSWGVLISQGAKTMPHANWLLYFPALFLISTLFALNFLGDGLRDALDPKDR
ncbi:ABC transporter permease subunit [Xinfangfangia pollutisoli]|uniref:ABC transporter permease subunit n=1 Tax=Xinfangfangia pollutisoli TaxID=2865960 RepID=UPI001CD57325|nr:ABC transporter permease subunit [Xinfangfangia pollutisoli]